MSNIKNEKIAIPIVLLAGIVWSFGPYVVRQMDDPNLVAWQYLFTRGLVIFLLLNIYLFFEEGKKFYKNYKNIGISGIIGGIGLGSAMICFIWSITNTSAAITLLCLASMPFITALLGFLFLKEKISFSVWISIILAAIGVAVMSFESASIGSITGLLFGLTSAIWLFYFFCNLKMEERNSKIYYSCFCRSFLLFCFFCNYCY